jgi:hypothetical protein
MNEENAQQRSKLFWVLLIKFLLHFCPNNLSLFSPHLRYLSMVHIYLMINTCVAVYDLQTTFMYLEHLTP